MSIVQILMEKGKKIAEQTATNKELLDKIKEAANY